MYYKEDELYNSPEGVFAEEYIFNWCGDYHIGLCINAQTLFCRADDCSDRHQHLSQTNKASSWLKMLDTICPKMAWGITAWLFFYSNMDDKGRLRFLSTTKAEVFAKYKEECWARYRHLQKDEYDYLRENGDTDGIKELDEAFFSEHIRTERGYISKFAHHECMTEEYYKAIVQCAKDYIEWVEDKKLNKVQGEVSNVERNSIIKQPKLIKEDELGKCFNAVFKGSGRNPNYFSELMDSLKLTRSNKEFAIIAHMIYESSYLIIKPNTFQAWYKQFCEYVGCKYIKSYKPSMLIPTDSLGKEFSFLFRG